MYPNVLEGWVLRVRNDRADLDATAQIEYDWHARSVSSVTGRTGVLASRVGAGRNGRRTRSRRRAAADRRHSGSLARTTTFRDRSLVRGVSTSVHVCDFFEGHGILSRAVERVRCNGSLAGSEALQIIGGARVRLGLVRMELVGCG